MYKQFSVISKRNFKFMSKVNRDCTGLSLQRYVVGPENLRSLFNQSDAKPNSFAFVRAFSSPHGLIAMLTLFPIGRCDSYGFSFTTLNRNTLS